VLAINLTAILILDKAADQEFPPEMFESQDVMTMPGTMGAATFTFRQENGKCGRCGLTAEQLGSHKCYDQRCGLK
jgi:ribosome biogenesis SPOUT family RNA methylase Rps3